MKLLLNNIARLILLAFCLVIPTVASASATNGTITNAPAYAWGENIGWMNFAAGDGVVAVTDGGLGGYVWTANYGWINLSPGGDFGSVTNDGEGTLGGHAWSALLGPISFTGVTISDAGVFGGTSNGVGSTAGRLSFDCDDCDVRTDWRPESVRNGQDSAPTPSGGSSGGGGDGGGGGGWVQQLFNFILPDSQNNPEGALQKGGQDSKQGIYSTESGVTTIASDPIDNQASIVASSDGAEPEVAQLDGITATDESPIKKWWWTLLAIPIVYWYFLLRRRLL